MANDLNDAVRTALRAVMAEHHVTQTDVANDLGRSQSYVSTRLGGRLDLTLDIVGAVGARAGFTPQGLMAELTARMVSTLCE